MDSVHICRMIAVNVFEGYTVVEFLLLLVGKMAESIPCERLSFRSCTQVLECAHWLLLWVLKVHTSSLTIRGGFW